MRSNVKLILLLVGITCFFVSLLLLSLELTGRRSDKYECKDSSSCQWNSWGGGNLRNTRHQKLYKPNVHIKTLDLLWVKDIGGDISCTPTVDSKGNIYATSNNGKIVSFNSDGDMRWIVWMSDLTGIETSFSRNSPAISPDDQYLVIGDQASGNVVILSPRNGSLIHLILINDHPQAIVTQSPTITEDVVYVGCASSEESAASNPNYTCCSFGGNFAAIDYRKGLVLWNHRTIPDELLGVGNYSGAPIWGSSPSIQDNLVCVATGNIYDAPAAVQECEANRESENDPSCVDPRIPFNSIMCFNKDNGSVAWVVRVDMYDAWNVGCGLPSRGIPPGPNCPEVQGPDLDFPQAPVLYGDDLLAVGQKAGILWIRKRSTGEAVCSLRTSPGSLLGGIMWGISVSEKSSKNAHPVIYVSNTNYLRQPFTLQNGTVINSSLLTAVDGTNCKVLWEMVNPNPSGYFMGPVSSVGDYVLVGNLSPKGEMYIIDGVRGRIVDTFESGAPVMSGPSIVGRRLYWGNGYTRFMSGTGGKLFSLRF